MLFLKMTNFQDLLLRYRQDPRTLRITENLTAANQPLFLSGMVGSQAALVAAAAFLQAPRHHVFILEDKETAAYFYNDLSSILSNKEILFFADSFKKSGYFDEVNKSNVLLRAESLSKFLNSNLSGELLVTYPEALFEKAVNPVTLRQNTLHFKIGELFDREFILDMLHDLGFEAADFVFEPGQFSLRGGIVDIYSFGNELPYRIELFDDTIESIRIFDPASQLSDRKITQATIVPNVQTQFDGGEKASFLDILPPRTAVWIKDMEAFFHAVPQWEQNVRATFSALAATPAAEEYPILKEAPEQVFINLESLNSGLLRHSLIEFGQKQQLASGIAVPYHGMPQAAFNKNFDLLIKDLKLHRSSGKDNFIFTDNVRQVQRLQQIFSDLGEPELFQPAMLPLHEGFVDYDLQVVCYTDHQIFDRYHKYQLKKGFSSQNALTLNLLRELQSGDFVVHIDHGIGRYSGLQKIEVNGKYQEAVRLIYRDNDILYVGINSLHKISKYVGKDGKEPSINKIGSDAWAAVKRKTKRQIKEIAFDLIQLYAKRKSSKGTAFAADTYLQAELEASFMYEDTPDQEQATIDVKRDMEAAYPMDRLICGDVGFGKTEIAVRATGKAIADGKQVAILVPTTILAMQHFKTFSERFKNFPVKIDFINRFKTTKEKKQTLEKLSTGELDVVIGTHGLLGKDVKFKDIGLLIIDEEQKFGVAAKEKLRNFKVNLDTLTLTATPIPRTLQFSLMSARDLSTISTPPPNRQPVVTELMTFLPEKIRDSIYFEYDRGGQVFFLHNRVSDIAEVANMIKKYCPDVEVGVAHGQMSNDDLEDHMVKFENRYYDVLVCTNIVETGLDIPNANTIIINNAQNFGLSDLHQLRGRVGRSNKKAFCYLITPPLFTLSDDSRKRLRTIEQFSDLGSGFQIAMKDLDIRGAGNLLGAEQSGFINDIGYETYMKILDEALRELKETEFAEVFKEELAANPFFVRDCQIDSDFEMLIPDEYVRSVPERLALYTRLDNTKTDKDLDKFAADLQDRFGKLPPQVHELFNAVRLRWVATRLGFEQLMLKGGKMRCYFLNNQHSAYFASDTFGKVLEFVKYKPHIATLKQSNNSLILIFEGVKNMRHAREFLETVEQFGSSEVTI